MRKNAWVICCCTAVLAAFGIFFRWLQDQVCFEEETGLAVRGSIWPYAVALMIVIAAVVLAVVCFRMKNQPHTSFPDSLPAAFVAVAALTIVTGAAFIWQMLSIGDGETTSGTVVCASMPIVLLAFWLIVSYKVNIINPTVSAYAVEILALCAALIAFYELAGFAYGRPKAIRSIFWSQFAAFLCITALPDDRTGGQQLMLAAIAGMLLFQSYLTASNIRPAVSGPVGGAQ